jgi:uncharacterized membrane protein YraQ (UPF0718 family)
MNWFSFHAADFSFSFLSILFEGVPFLLLGALIAGIVDVFVPARWITRLLPSNPTAAVLLSGLLGGVFPMCECGSVIVIRRFIAKGLPVSCAIAYMLAAPIVSPLVALSTFAAFQGQSPWVMTFMRLLLGYGVAVGTALIVQRLRLENVLQPKILATIPRREGERDRDEVAFTSKAERGGLTVAAAPSAVASWKTEGRIGQWLRVVRSSTADFLDVALFFVIGTAITAIFNTAVDQSLILPLASNGPLATVSMMGLAGVLALCSSTDAFIAATFVAFPFTAKLAFLVFGPVFDVKLFFLYGVIFRRRFIVLLSVGLFIAIALICMKLTLLDV